MARPTPLARETLEPFRQRHQGLVHRRTRDLAILRAMTERPPTPLPAGILEYELPGGWQCLAGKTDAANDYVSIKLARARDRWFHVRGMPGGHVVLRVTEEQEPDRATLERAAGIAAYHSKARTGGIVAVSMTEGRHVSKPRGARPGTVEIRKESVLRVRPATEEAISTWRKGKATGAA